ncbi:amidohydrolase, partial [Staphylococcus ureilyticus]
DIGVTSISEPATLPFNKKQASKVAREVNEYQAQLKKDYPECFKSFALLPMPYIKQSINEVVYALDELKLDGIGLLSNYGDQYLGDDIFE